MLLPIFWNCSSRPERYRNLDVGFMTNAMLLDARWAKTLVDMQVDFSGL
ncbi:MAG: hypothetical protein U5L00_21245 [Desulfovermiculus sp.]|nr:hypothetical protein [Desulfovermiculus sp.]